VNLEIMIPMIKICVICTNIIKKIYIIFMEKRSNVVY